MIEIKIMGYCVMGVILVVGAIKMWLIAKIEKQEEKDLADYIDRKVAEKVAEATAKDENPIVAADAKPMERLG